MKKSFIALFALAFSAAAFSASENKSIDYQKNPQTQSGEQVIANPQIDNRKYCINANVIYGKGAVIEMGGAIFQCKAPLYEKELEWIEKQ
ncbi:DUF1496 domain-containing protein [Vibrio fluvialis]|uniref:DUF1496 domain-containing protein n=1 Tax=Vibrio fluvialis TaxID=676 RepID=UPI00192B4221|nr:DUF1496 domain-containing protein [Vibrio fluvialis]MBL4262848.1 DUF1496 domain-containing protein [Vibrio fluvialis]